jgi:hypothetical protein
MTTLTDTAELTISTTVWDDPLAVGGLDADSDDALVTGRACKFESGECRRVVAGWDR